MTTTKDLHLSIERSKSNSGNYFIFDMVFLPFTFTIKKYNGTERIFIEKNSYFEKFTNETQQFIENHLDIPLKTINDIEVFDYIQNWSEYSSCKNVHAQFTYIMRQIPIFYLSQFPVNYQDLRNEYEFEDNQIIKIQYGFSLLKIIIQVKIH